MPYNSVTYIREAGGPGELEKHVTDIQGSGVTTVIVGMLHVGCPRDSDPGMQLGDFVYNDYPQGLLVRGGKFNPNGSQAIKDWPGQVARLKQQGSVQNVFLVVGSPPEYWPDFETMQKMFAEGKADLLKQNLVALKEALTIDGRCAIDGFDIDCEESLDQGIQDTVVRFCKMVFELGFKVTFCPYQVGGESWWQDCMQTLWDQGMKVSWWNLQCYSGGFWNLNKLQPWIDALGKVVGGDGAAYLVPGLAPAGEEDVGGDVHCPSGSGSFETIAAGWHNPKLGGMFLWRYDPLALAKNQGLCGGQNNLKNYVKAINDGLSKG
jgi:hypothetical protein